MSETAKNTCLTSTLDVVNNEVRSIYGDLMDDIISKKSILNMISCEIMPCYEIKEIFDKKTKFEVVFCVNWTNKTVNSINSGLSGLILDELEKNNIFSNIMFENFFSMLNSLVLKNKKLKNILILMSMEEISRKYKNSYKLVKVEDVFLNFIGRGDGSYIPNVCLEIHVERG